MHTDNEQRFSASSVESQYSDVWKRIQLVWETELRIGMARVPTSRTSIWWQLPIDRRSSIHCDVSNWSVLRVDVHSRYPIPTFSTVEKTFVVLASNRRAYMNSTESCDSASYTKSRYFLLLHDSIQTFIALTIRASVTLLPNWIPLRILQSYLMTTHYVE
jgi:hypothetical protein